MCSLPLHVAIPVPPRPEPPGHRGFSAGLLWHPHSLEIPSAASQRKRACQFKDFDKRHDSPRETQKENNLQRTHTPHHNLYCHFSRPLPRAELVTVCEGPQTAEATSQAPRTTVNTQLSHLRQTASLVLFLSLGLVPFAPQRI